MHFPYICLILSSSPSTIYDTYFQNITDVSQNINSAGCLRILPTGSNAFLTWIFYHYTHGAYLCDCSWLIYRADTVFLSCTTNTLLCFHWWLNLQAITFQRYQCDDSWRNRYLPRSPSSTFATDTTLSNRRVRCFHIEYTTCLMSLHCDAPWSYGWK